MKWKQVVWLALPLLSLAMYGCEKEWQSSERIVSIKTDQAPTLDGVADAGLWDRARIVMLTLNRVTEVTKQESALVPATMGAHVRAIHTDSHVYFLVAWTDSYKADVRSPLVWRETADGGGFYEPMLQQDDEVSLMFTMSGDYKRLLTEDTQYHADLWQWGAGRTNASGYALDAKLVLTRVRPSPDAKIFEHNPTKQDMWIWTPQDSGSPAFARRVPSEFKGDTIDPQEVREPSGSAGDVQAKGQWHEDLGLWAVEFGRKRDTGYDDDGKLGPPIVGDLSVAIVTVGPTGRALTYLSPPARLVFEGSQGEWNFDKCRRGEKPLGLEVQAGNWIASQEPTAPSPGMALAQIATSSREDSKPSVLLKTGEYENFELSASVRFVPGSTESAAGLLLRQVDRGSNYRFEVNCRRGLVRLVRFSDGVGKVLSPHLEREIRIDVWHRLKVLCQADRFTCYLDGEEVLQVRDGSYTDGQVGLWTYADTNALFDDVSLRIRPMTPSEQPAAE